jgi:integrase
LHLGRDPSASIHVHQRADAWKVIGPPKSSAGARTVPLPPMLASILPKWKLACPPGDLVFPNGAGKIEELANILARGLEPTMVKAGLVTKDGKVKYPGMHALRHF